jgi:hypothetical protein
LSGVGGLGAMVGVVFVFIKDEGAVRSGSENEEEQEEG